MSFKIITDAQGNVVAYGPDDDNYEPTVPLGYTLSIVDVLPSITKSHAQIIQDLERAFDLHLDAVAEAKGYKREGVRPSASCIGYAGFPNRYQAEGIAFGQWVADCCAVANQIQADAVAGLRPIPTETELIAALPVMVWPV